MNEIDVFVDGGCRRNGMENPEPYGSFRVVFKGETKKHVQADFNGADVRTSNQAEYGTLLRALHYIQEVYYRKPDLKATWHMYIDSALIYNQLTGHWKVRDSRLKQYHLACWHVINTYDTIVLHKVDRSEIVAQLGH